MFARRLDPVGARLAREANDARHQINRRAHFAGKPRSNKSSVAFKFHDISDVDEGNREASCLTHRVGCFANQLAPQMRGVRGRGASRAAFPRGAAERSEHGPVGANLFARRLG